MVHQHENIFLSKKLKEQQFGILFATTLKEITGELNKIYQSFYSYNIPEDTSKGIDNLFRIIERTWVGIFNNALLKAEPSITTLQEFSVWSSDRNIGRCDFLFRYQKDNKKSDFVTEVKLYEFTDNWNNDTVKTFYKAILGKAFIYYSTEKKYYDDYDSGVWLMAFVVEWIRDEERLKSADKIMRDWKGETDSETDFLTLYKGVSRGAFVYGKVIKANEFENLNANL